jgi:MFS family permease
VTIFIRRDFALFWTGETTSALGSSVSKLALPLVALGPLHASAFQVSLLTAAGWLPWLLVGLPAGAWVDRLPRRPLMQLCNLASVLLLLSVPIAHRLGVLGIGQLLAVALLCGVAGVFFQTAYQVYLPAVVGDGDLTQANAALQGSESVAQVAGPGLAGLIAQLSGAVAGLVVDAASFLVSSGCLLFVRAADQPPISNTIRAPGRAWRSRDAGEPEDGLAGQIRQGLRFVRGDAYLRSLTLFGAASNLALTGYQAVLVVFLVRDVGLSSSGVGLVLSGMSVGGVLGAAGAGALARRLGTARAILVAELGAAPFALLVPLTRPGLGLACVVVGGVGIGAGIVAGNVIKTSFRQSYTPHELLGRVTVSMQFLNYGTIPLGSLIGGVLATALGLRPTLWIMAVALVLGALTLLLGPIRHGRELPVRPTQSALVQQRVEVA